MICLFASKPIGFEGSATTKDSPPATRWRATVPPTVPEGHRFEATQALRQVLNRAVAWGVLDFNPAKRGMPNAQRRPKEKRPLESWAQIEAIAARLGPMYGPMVIFGAATGLRPSELFGLEQHDVDRELGVVYVRRAFANGRIKNTKTRLSTRAVPLQAKAVEALDRLRLQRHRAWRQDRLPRLRPPSLAARPGLRRHR